MPSITVEGTPYVLPALDTFDLDEAIILYEYSGLTFDQVWELEGLHPGVIKALLHVAVQRSDVALRQREVKEMVGQVNMIAVMVELAALAEEMPDPTLGGQPPVESDSQNKQRRVNEIFWERWKRRFGALPGEVEPRLYWSPHLGDSCNLRPGDVGSLTPDQLMDAYDHRSQRVI